MYKRLIALPVLVFLFGATAAFAQNWKVVTPRQVLPVPSDGSTVNFPNVNLVAGMKYRVHATGEVTVSNSGEMADACYYIYNSFLHFNPTITPVSLKLRNTPTTEDWFYNFWNASGFQGGNYQSSHTYDASVLSFGSALSFRFFDTKEPPSPYYGDNSGSILIDVARETPGIVIQKDTLDFGSVRVGIPKSLPDSIDTYGVDGLNIDHVSMTGTSAAKFSVISEYTLPHVFTDTTNEFLFTYSPTNAGRDSAEFHIFSTNAFGADAERIIYLYGNGISTKLAFTTDTLDFGSIRTGTSKTLPDSIINPGNTPVNIISITPETPGSSFTPIGAPLTAFTVSNAQFNVKFTPPNNGNYFEKFDVLTDDGSVFHFYAKGIAGVPIVYLGQNVLDFGKVILGQQKKLSVKYGNSGIGPLNIVATNFNNAAEYSLANPILPSYPGGEIDSLTFIFSPKVHIPGCGDHPGSFTINYDDGTSTTIVFKGCDHLPVQIKLVIDTLYFVPAGQMIDVTEKLIEPGDPLDSTINPVTLLNEEVDFDPMLFDLVSLSKGSIINSPDWTLTQKTIPMHPEIISFAISSSTSRFTSAGPLVVFKFRAHADDKKGQFTDLVQGHVVFDVPLELRDTESAGRITISDICSPVGLEIGNAATSVEQNTPNPFNPLTHIHYAIGRDAINGVSSEAVHVKITLFDQTGRLTAVLADEDKVPGSYNLVFDGSAYPTGTYTYIFQAGDHIESKKMILLK